MVNLPLPHCCYPPRRILDSSRNPKQFKDYQPAGLRAHVLRVLRLQRPLIASQERRSQSAGMGTADPKVLSYGDVLLRASDVATLSPYGWVNDQVGK